MNKKIVALAVAAAFAVPVAASAQTTLFGQFKYEVGFISDGDDHNAVHSTAGTRLGVHGSENLGGGMQAIYRFQSGFPGGSNTPLGNRSFTLSEEAWVGLRGDFGRVLLGRSDTAFKLANVPFRGFTDTLADPNNRPASFGRAEGVHYTSPSFGGLTVAATVEPMGAKLDSYYSLAAIYRAGPLFVAAAVEDASSSGIYGGNNSNGRAIRNGNTNWQIGASYKVDALTVGVLYQDIDVTPGNPPLGGAGAKWITVPVTYTLSPTVTLRAALQYRDRDYASSMTNVALGAQYNFSNRTEVFANVWNDGKRDQIRTDNAPAPGQLGAGADTHFGIGMRHSF